VVAGPNGSGKSTLTKWNRESFQSTAVLDPDAVAKAMHGDGRSSVSAIDAGRAVLLLAGALLQQQQSFVVETTLSGNTYPRMMRRAKALGFHVVLIFIGTANVEINLQRVRDRVIKGGHDVPEEDQRRRYSRSMKNLEIAFRLADEAILYDNSMPRGYALVAEKTETAVTIFKPIPPWAGFLNDWVTLSASTEKPTQ
jgi:predicted ABC-type ATPase